MAALSGWLQLMLAEIARKQETCERAREEADKRLDEESSPPAAARPVAK